MRLDAHSRPPGTMQRRSLSHKRLETVHQFSAPAKSKSATAKNEWGENFIMDRQGPAASIAPVIFDCCY